MKKYILLLVVLVCVLGAAIYVPLSARKVTNNPASESIQVTESSNTTPPTEQTMFRPIPGDFLKNYGPTNMKTLNDERGFKYAYVEDGTAVYFVSGSAVKMSNADLDTFQVLRSNLEAYPFALDKQNVYFMGQLIPGADPKTFESFSTVFSKDANHVFYSNSTVRSADAQTFQEVDMLIHKDKNHVFCVNYSASEQVQILDGADPTTIQRADHSSPGTTYLKDSRNVYDLKTCAAVPGANPADY